MTLLLATNYFYNMANASLQEESTLGFNSWNFIHFLEIVIFAPVLAYLLTPKNRRIFKLNNPTIVLAFLLPFVLGLILYLLMIM